MLFFSFEESLKGISYHTHVKNLMVYMCMYMYVCVYVCMYVCMHVYIHVCMYVCMYVCMCLLYVAARVCMYVCVHEGEGEEDHNPDSIHPPCLYLKERKEGRIGVVSHSFSKRLQRMCERWK